MGTRIRLRSLTQEELKKQIEYNPDTGLWRWKQPQSKKNKEWFSGANSRGYRIINIDRNPYGAHILAWLYMTGSWPIHEIDHINNIAYDNRWENLQVLSRSQNVKKSWEERRRKEHLAKGRLLLALHS